MPEPFELVAGPFEIYVADVGTAFPAIDAVPSGGWELLGVSGAENISEDGIMITPEQNVNRWRGLGSILPKKPFRTSEDLKIAFNLADATLEAYAQVMATVNTVVTASGVKSLSLERGSVVAVLAMLIRGDGISPYGDGFNTQWEIPRVFQNGNPETKYTKGEPVGLACEFYALQAATPATLRSRFES